MDPIIQRLQIEALKSQLSLMQLGHAYISNRCQSTDGMVESTRELLRQMENVRMERAVLERELELTECKVRPMWG